MVILLEFQVVCLEIIGTVLIGELTSPVVFDLTSENRKPERIRRIKES